jgi:hypothetical protein
MVGKMIELWLSAKRDELAADDAYRDEVADAVPADFSYPLARGEVANDLERLARWELERLLLKHGDDGVMEQIRDHGGGGRASREASQIAESLLNRDLYKPAANALRPAAADDLHKRFGSAAARRKLEHEACKHAGIKSDWHVLLWIPDPKMRLKLAGLLVDDGRGIAQFKDKSQLGSDIYADHKALWTISVFVHPGVTTDQTRDALARLGQLLGVSWDAHRAELGTDPGDAPAHLGAVRLLKATAADERVSELVALSKSGEIAARGGPPETQEALQTMLAELAEQHGMNDA